MVRCSRVRQDLAVQYLANRVLAAQKMVDSCPDASPATSGETCERPLVVVDQPVRIYKAL